VQRHFLVHHPAHRGTGTVHEAVDVARALAPAAERDQQHERRDEEKGHEPG